MAEDSVIITYCSGGFFPIELPTLFWFGTSGVGFFNSEISIFWFSVTYYPQQYINYVLKRIFSEPYPLECRIGLDTPSLEIQLLYSYLFFLMGFTYLRGKKTGTLRWIFNILLAVGCPVWLYLTNNNSLKSLLLGALVGLILGMIDTYCIWIFVIQSGVLKIINSWKFIKIFGYQETIFLKPVDNNDNTKKINKNDNTQTDGIDENRLVVTPNNLYILSDSFSTDGGITDNDIVIDDENDPRRWNISIGRRKT